VRVVFVESVGVESSFLGGCIEGKVRFLACCIGRKSRLLDGWWNGRIFPRAVREINSLAWSIGIEYVVHEGFIEYSIVRTLLIIRGNIELSGLGLKRKVEPELKIRIQWRIWNMLKTFILPVGLVRCWYRNFQL